MRLNDVETGRITPAEHARIAEERMRMLAEFNARKSITPAEYASLFTASARPTRPTPTTRWLAPPPPPPPPPPDPRQRAAERNLSALLASGDFRSAEVVMNSKAWRGERPTVADLVIRVFGSEESRQKAKDARRRRAMTPEEALADLKLHVHGPVPRLDEGRSINSEVPAPEPLPKKRRDRRKKPEPPSDGYGWRLAFDPAAPPFPPITFRR